MPREYFVGIAAAEGQRTPTTLFDEKCSQTRGMNRWGLDGIRRAEAWLEGASGLAFVAPDLSCRGHQALHALSRSPPLLISSPLLSLPSEFYFDRH